MPRMVFLDHPELSGRVSLQRNYKRATLSSAKNTLEIVETIGTAKTGMQVQMLFEPPCAHTFELGSGISDLRQGKMPRLKLYRSGE